MANVDFGRYKRLVQYFWDPAPTNDATSELPIWCLGQQYKVNTKSSIPFAGPPITTLNLPPHKIPSVAYAPAVPAAPQATTLPESNTNSINLAGIHEGSSVPEDGGWPTQFMDDIEARLWLTYRSNFPAIPRSRDPKALSTMSLSVRVRSQLGDQSGFTSDTGWGCMIRSGQSILANSLIILRMGRDWRRGHKKAEERAIISLFADDPKAPYSIHKFVDHGAVSCGKHPGEWFGPSATARCIQALTNNQANSDLRVYITGDGPDVYEDSFMKIARQSDAVFKPTLILIGTRLGVDKITPVYWEALKATLQLPQSIGIAGGRPSSSLYFVGFQGMNLFYLDPHHTRPALTVRDNISDYTEEEISSYHTRRLRKIHMQEMDPSMLIAFLIKDEADWRAWRSAVEQVPGKRVIHVADHDPASFGRDVERDSAIDEVESFDDDDEDEAVVV